MKCGGFSQIADLADYLDKNRLVARYCGFDIMILLTSYWTYDRFLKKLDNGGLKKIISGLVKQLYELRIADASFIGLNSTPVSANTKQNNPKSFAKDKFKPENHTKAGLDFAFGVHSAFNRHNEKRYALADCVFGFSLLHEATTPANIEDSTVAVEILAATNQTISLRECSFLADKGYDAKSVYNAVKSVYEGEAFIPLNKRGAKRGKKLSDDNPICDAGLAMRKDGKVADNGRTRQKFCRL